MTTTVHTAFGPVKTASTRPFIAIVKTERGAKIGKAHLPAGVHVHARAETREALIVRLKREGFRMSPTGTTGVIHERAMIVQGVPMPGALTATVEIAEVK